MSDFVLNHLQNIVMNVFTIGMSVLFLIGTVRQLVKSLRKPVTVRARVLDKTATNRVAISSCGPSRTVTDYVVVFGCGSKTVRFLTSVWFYDSVEVNEVGTLTYQGDRVIGFE